MADQVSERREHPRLNLRLSVVFAPQEAGISSECRGETTNVSAGGACFETVDWQHLRPMDRLSLRISGFSRYGTGSLFRELRGSGTVLRIEPQRQANGTPSGARVAIRFDEPPHFEVYDWVD